MFAGFITPVLQNITFVKKALSVKCPSHIYEVPHNPGVIIVFVVVANFRAAEGATSVRGSHFTQDVGDGNEGEHKGHQQEDVQQGGGSGSL